MLRLPHGLVLHLLLAPPSHWWKISISRFLNIFSSFPIIFFSWWTQGEENTSYIKIQFTFSILGQTLTRERKMPAIFKWQYYSKLLDTFCNIRLIFVFETRECMNKEKLFCLNYGNMRSSTAFLINYQNTKYQQPHH